MTVAILHHAGDANAPPVRVPHTFALATSLPGALVLLGLKCAESASLARLLPSRVDAFSGASDTLTEVTTTYPHVLRHRATTLYVSTEPGHVGRAALIARIVYWRRGVRVVPSPSAPGTYQSPLRRTCLDAVRAFIFRLTGRVVMV